MRKLLGVFILAISIFSCNQSVENVDVYVTIDSISQHQRYTTLPSYYYNYHTNIGVIPTNDLNYKVGDVFKIKTVKITK